MQNYRDVGAAQGKKIIFANAAIIRPKPRGLKNCFRCENSHKRKDFRMIKILAIDVPDNISEVSISYSNLLGAKFVGRAKLHSLPQPKHVEAKSLEDASIQMCQDTGWNMCLDAIRNLSE
jgi:hypothetical protein